MEPTALGAAGLLALPVLLACGMPIAFLLMGLGLAGLWALAGPEAALPVPARVLYETAAHYPFSLIPLFVFMGHLAGAGGVTRDLYTSFDIWLRRLPGGLALATLGACAGFAAICGSSVAAAAAMGSVALPEMRRFGYSPRLATGVVAAGGTLSFLIPPSLGFVVYGMLTEQSIGKLLVAGILPGGLLCAAYGAVVVCWSLLFPAHAPAQPHPSSAGEKLRALKGVWQSALLFALVMGGIYSGRINPTEAGGVGALALVTLLACRRRLTREAVTAALAEASRVTVMVLFLVAGATVFSTFLALSTIPSRLAAAIADLGLSAGGVLVVLTALYLLLGCFLDAVSMLVLTLPVVFPLIAGLGVSPIWFGVFCVLMMEAGLITPPVGLNVYTIAGLAAPVPAGEIFKGTLPFLAAVLLTAALLAAFPGLALVLPDLMGR